MQHDEFIGRVQERARLDSRGAAETATRAFHARAVMSVVADAVSGGQLTRVRDQLPRTGRTCSTSPSWATRERDAT